MKMFTRLAAMMILAAMSLSLFTACGIEDWLNEQTGAEGLASAGASSTASSTAPVPLLPASSSSETTAPSEEKKDEEKPADKEEEKEDEEDEEEDDEEEETSKLVKYFKNYTSAYSYSGTIHTSKDSNDFSVWIANSGTSAYVNDIVCKEPQIYWYQTIAQSGSDYYYNDGGRDEDWYKDDGSLAYLKETFRFYNQIFLPNTSNVASGTDGDYVTETISGTRFSTPVKITYYFSGNDLKKIRVNDDDGSGVYCEFYNFTLSPKAGSELDDKISIVKTNADPKAEKVNVLKEALASYSGYTSGYTYISHNESIKIICDSHGKCYVGSESGSSSAYYTDGSTVWKKEYGEWKKIEDEDEYKDEYNYTFKALANVFAQNGSVQYMESTDDGDRYKKNNTVNYYVDSTSGKLKKIEVDAVGFSLDYITMNEYISINLENVTEYELMPRACFELVVHPE